MHIKRCSRARSVGEVGGVVVVVAAAVVVVVGRRGCLRAARQRFGTVARQYTFRWCPPQKYGILLGRTLIAIRARPSTAPLALDTPLA